MNKLSKSETDPSHHIHKVNLRINQRSTYRAPNLLRKEEVIRLSLFKQPSGFIWKVCKKKKEWSMLSIILKRFLNTKS